MLWTSHDFLLLDKLKFSVDYTSSLEPEEKPLKNTNTFRLYPMLTSCFLLLLLDWALCKQYCYHLLIGTTFIVVLPICRIVFYPKGTTPLLMMLKKWERTTKESCLKKKRYKNSCSKEDEGIVRQCPLKGGPNMKKRRKF